MLKGIFLGGRMESLVPLVLLRILSTLKFLVKKNPDRQNIDMVVNFLQIYL